MATLDELLSIQLQQQGVLERVNKALDPEILRQRVKFTLELTEAQGRLNDALNKEMEAQGLLATRARAEDDRRLSAIRSINEGIEAQKEALSRLREAQSPESLREQVRLEGQLADARRQHAKALDEERRKQGQATGPGALSGLSGLLGAASGLGGKLGQGAGALSKLFGAVGQGGGGGGGAGGAMSGAAGAIGAAVGAAVALRDAFKGLTGAMIDLAGKANAAALQKFNYAMADTTAVLGRVFVPVLEVFTRTVRGWGDVLASILPTSQELRPLMGGFNQYLASMRDLYTELAPLIRGVLLTALTALSRGLSALASVIGKVTQALSYPIRMLQQLGVLSRVPLASSVGAAPRPASITGVDAYLNKAYTQAYSAGMEGRRPESAMDKVARFTEYIAGAIKRWEDRADRAASTVRDTARDPVGAGADVVGGALGEITWAARRFLRRW